MALQSKKVKAARIKCVVAGIPGTGVIIDHNNCKRGDTVTPKDASMTQEGQLVEADSNAAKSILASVKAVKTAAKKAVAKKAAARKAAK